MNMAIVVAAIGVVAVLVSIVGIATKKMPLVITAMALLGICIKLLVNLDYLFRSSYMSV